MLYPTFWYTVPLSTSGMEPQTLNSLLTTEGDKVMTNLARREIEDETKER
jgi:hypothetical protein